MPRADVAEGHGLRAAALITTCTCHGHPPGSSEGATGRRLPAMNAARCRRAGRAGGRGGDGRRASQSAGKPELEEENMELAGCVGYSSS